MTGLRKAALLINALDETDRKWVLKSLTKDENDRLSSYLTELENIEFCELLDIDDVDEVISNFDESCIKGDESLYEDKLNDASSLFAAIAITDLSLKSVDYSLYVATSEEAKEVKKIANLRVLDDAVPVGMNILRFL